MFRYFKKIYYNDNGIKREVSNIVNAFVLRRVEIEYASMFQKYRIEGRETPESISDKMYGTVDFYWTIMLVNNIIDPYTDWATDFYEIEQLCEKKYPSGIEGIHHFFNVNKNRMCDDYDDYVYRIQYTQNPESLPEYIRPVTNFEYEQDRNGMKRDITIIHPRAIRKFVEDFKVIFES